MPLRQEHWAKVKETAWFFRKARRLCFKGAGIRKAQRRAGPCVASPDPRRGAEGQGVVRSPALVCQGLTRSWLVQSPLSQLQTLPSPSSWDMLRVDRIQQSPAPVPQDPRTAKYGSMLMLKLVVPTR